MEVGGKLKVNVENILYMLKPENFGGQDAKRGGANAPLQMPPCAHLPKCNPGY